MHTNEPTDHSGSSPTCRVSPLGLQIRFRIRFQSTYDRVVSQPS